MVLVLLDLDAMRDNFGIDAGYVPAPNESVQATLANIAGGGLAEDYTDKIHNDFVEAGHTMVAALRCPVLAVDFLCDDPTSSFVDNSGEVLFLETNTSPGIDLHQYPHVGPSRNVASAYIDYLLEHGG
jgi:cyanophycin synthetase